jgi:hypothetical protein
VVVYDEARLEALVEGSSMGGGCCDGTKEGVLLDEEVFLAQLHRRAQLLNDEFQERVAAVVLAHAAGGEGAEEEDLGGDFEKEEDLLESEEGIPAILPAAGSCGSFWRKSSALIAAVRASPLALALVRVWHWLGKSKTRVDGSSSATARNQAERVSACTAGGIALAAATVSASDPERCTGKEGTFHHDVIAAEGQSSGNAVLFESSQVGSGLGMGLRGPGGLVRGCSDGTILQSELDGRKLGSSLMSAGSATRAVCEFKEGRKPVEVYAAPVKTLARMREKVFFFSSFCRCYASLPRLHIYWLARAAECLPVSCHTHHCFSS